jgi:alpha-tubulin suppressor-like RCC1 family protein
VSAGYRHGVALKSDGTVWAWGLNTSGQLGDGTTNSTTSAVQVSGLSGVTKISAGDTFTIALKSDKTLVAWGKNSSGQLGIGSSTNQVNSPTAIPGLGNIVDISAGVAHVLALQSDGTVWVWGYNSYGQLGDGTTSKRLSPVHLTGINSVLGIAAGDNHSLILKSDGSVWTSGLNTNGQLGNGTNLNSSTFTQVPSLDLIAP